MNKMNRSRGGSGRSCGVSGHGRRIRILKIHHHLGGAGPTRTRHHGRILGPMDRALANDSPRGRRHRGRHAHVMVVMMVVVVMATHGGGRVGPRLGRGMRRGVGKRGLLRSR